MTEHVHEWKGAMFMDGCHSYTNCYLCACGKTLTIWAERQFWLRGKITPEVYMMNRSCKRCNELFDRTSRRRPRHRTIA